LLKEAKVDTSLATPTEEREAVTLTTGMKTLIRGNNTAQPDGEIKSQRTRSLGYSLLAGDIALCLTAWRLVRLQNETMDLVLALGAIMLAGWLGWLGAKLILNSTIEHG
jgi:hypothetical protein